MTRIATSLPITATWPTFRPRVFRKHRMKLNSRAAKTTVGARAWIACPRAGPLARAAARDRTCCSGGA